MILALLLALQGAPVAAPTPVPGDPATDPRCTTVRAAVPAGFAGWSTRVPLTAGAAPRNAPVLTIGGGADLRLAAFTPAMAPGKEPAPGTLGGLALFEVRRAGTYRVGLGTGAWVDVVRGGRPVASSAHGHRH